MKNILSLSIFVLLYFFSFSQSLQNTNWEYVDGNSNTIQADFETDTIRLSQNGNFGVIGWFRESNDTLWTFDVYGSGAVCPVSDTGIYTFVVSNDTLNFTMVKDDCGVRSTDMGLPWVKKVTSTGLDQKIKNAKFNVYPNPSQGTFTIETPSLGTYEILTLDGSIVTESNLVQGKNDISIDLEPGIYLIRISFNGISKTQKFLIE